MGRTKTWRLLTHLFIAVFSLEQNQSKVVSYFSEKLIGFILLEADRLEFSLNMREVVGSEGQQRVLRVFESSGRGSHKVDYRRDDTAKLVQGIQSPDPSTNCLPI
jgi:hypothetical protein